jgi:ABC-type multidrug transport system ATPase subunit
MREAEELCDTIAFIKQGRILAHGTPDVLKRQIRLGEALVLKLDPPMGHRLAELPGVLAVRPQGDAVECTVDSVEKRLPDILRFVHEQGGVVRGCEVREPDLEEVFVELAR